MRRQGTGSSRGGGAGVGARAASSAKPCFRLQSVRLAGFRSFKQQETVTFGHAGLTCITGPNGAGKSTLINAILFGLGENANQLGAKQNAELASAAHAEVELVFRSVSHGISDIKVSSVVSRANGQRTYAFNGQKLPKHRFDHLLRVQLGIAMGNPFWRVSQDGIQQLLHASPHALHDSMCEVSGTKAINAHRSNAIKQLGRWRRSLADIQSNIAALEEAVGKESTHLKGMDRIREITEELDVIPAEMKLLDREIACAEEKAAATLLERLTCQAQALEAEKTEKNERVRALRTEMIRIGERTSGADGQDGSEALQKSLLKVLTDLAEASTEATLEAAALREKEELKGRWKLILQEARRERKELEAKSVALRDRILGLRERRGKLEEEVRRARARLLAAEGSQGSRDEVLREARQALDNEHKAAIVSIETRYATASSAASRAEADVSRRRSKAAAVATELDEVWESMKQLGSPLHAAEDAQKYLRGIKDQRCIQRSRQLDLSREVEAARQNSAGARRSVGAPEWSSKLLLVPTGPAEETKDATGGRRVGDGGRGGGASRDGVTSRCQQGHRGFLFELFELQQEGSNAEKYFQGLASLLSGSLTVWVCTTSQEADEALDLAKANGAGLRVWPSERLRSSSRGLQRRCTKVAQSLDWAARTWPGQVKVVDPASLLIWDTADVSSTAAMEKALGGWVIAEDDEVSALLLSELRQSSITAQGVRHAPGEVIGGDAGGEDAKLRAKVQWDLAVRQRRERTEALDACVEGSRDLTRRLQAGTELVRLRARRCNLKQEHEECSQQLLESQTVLAAAQKCLQWADAERSRLDNATQTEKAALASTARSATEAGVLSTLRTAMEIREQDLEAVRAAYATIEEEIGNAAEASMEAFEREQNAKDALDMRPTIDREDHDDNFVGESNAMAGGDGGDISSRSTVVSGSNGVGCGNTNGAAAPSANGQLATLKQSVERKVARVAELERARDDLTARVEETNAQEQSAGDRLSGLEEEIAEARSALQNIETRIKAQSKSLKEAERRIGQTKAANQQCREGDRVSGTRRRGFSAGADNHIRNSSTEALMSTDSTHDMARGVSFEAVVAEAVETGTGGLAGGDDRNVNKENLPSTKSVEELAERRNELSAKEKFLSGELRGLRRQSQEPQRGGRRGGQAQVVAGRVDETTVRQRQAKVVLLKRQLESVLEATRQLEAGVVACEGRMFEANEACYSVVRRELQTLFGALCTTKSADLVFAGDKLEDGLHLVVRNETATATETAAERSPHELSGGQQALLGLSLVLALSSYQAPPLCLLDEIDAALDESNQASAARLVGMAFENGQALCVSHHSVFHQQSGHCVAVEMRDGVTRVQRNS